MFKVPKTKSFLIAFPAEVGPSTPVMPSFSARALQRLDDLDAEAEARLENEIKKASETPDSTFAQKLKAKMDSDQCVRAWRREARAYRHAYNYCVEAKGRRPRYFKYLSSAAKCYSQRKKENGTPKITSLRFDVSVYTSLHVYRPLAKNKAPVVVKDKVAPLYGGATLYRKKPFEIDTSYVMCAWGLLAYVSLQSLVSVIPF